MTQDVILTEGRRRLRLSAPWLTDEMFATWVASACQRGADFALTLEGVVARYDLKDAPQGTVGAR